MPSSSPLYARIRGNTQFVDLVARRNRLTLSLLVVIVAVFYAYMGLVSFWPELIARRLAESSNLTFGVAAGVALFVFICALSGFYVYRANGEFDRMTRELIAQVEQEEAR